jgi:hypothetical protein
MNKSDISKEASDRFRIAASQYKPTKSRASRLLPLKEEIAALRKRGISCRAISELLNQNGITASDTCVTNFCHRVLNERFIRKSSAKRRASPHSKQNPSPTAEAKITLPITMAPFGKPSVAPAEVASFTTCGPRIAKVEQLPPGEKI